MSLSRIHLSIYIYYIRCAHIAGTMPEIATDDVTNMANTCTTASTTFLHHVDRASGDRLEHKTRKRREQSTVTTHFIVKCINV